MSKTITLKISPVNTFNYLCPHCHNLLCLLESNKRLSEMYSTQEYIFSDGDTIVLSKEKEFGYNRFDAALNKGECLNCGQNYFTIQLGFPSQPINNCNIMDEYPTFINDLGYFDDEIDPIASIFLVNSEEEVAGWPLTWSMLRRVYKFNGQPISIDEHWIGPTTVTEQDLLAAISQLGVSSGHTIRSENDIWQRAIFIVEAVLESGAEIASLSPTNYFPG